MLVYLLSAALLCVCVVLGQGEGWESLIILLTPENYAFQIFQLKQQIKI